MKYETHIIENPKIPFIFHTMHQTPEHLTCHCNWHENIEILLFTSRSGILQLGEELFPFCEGDAVVINPNTQHTIPSNEKVDYLCLIVDRSFFLENHVDSNEIRFDTRIRDDTLTKLMSEFGTVYFAPEDTPWRILRLRSYALQIVTLLCNRYGHTEEKTNADSRMLSAIKQGIGLIRSEYAKNLSLEYISKFVGLSKYYFAREFRRITGYSVVFYLNMTRCKNAKTLLAKKEVTIGEIGLSCGFANPSYFTRTFRTHTGLTPHQYRERCFSEKKR